MNTKLAEHNSLEKYFFRRKTFSLAVVGQFSDKTESSQARNTIYFPSRLGGEGAGGAGGEY